MLPTRIHRGDLWRSPFDLMGGFDRVFRPWLESEDNETAANGGLIGKYPVDVHEDENHLYVEAEMPGFQKDEVNVTLEKGILIISAERKTPEAKGEQHLAERRYTKVQRSFTLPVEVDENKVEAKLTDGVLHLTLNKREEVKPRKIEVK